MDQISSLGRLQSLASDPKAMMAILLAAVFFNASPAVQTLMGSGDSGRLMSFAVVLAAASLALTFGFWLSEVIWEIISFVAEQAGLF